MQNVRINCAGRAQNGNDFAVEDDTKMGTNTPEASSSEHSIIAVEEYFSWRNISEWRNAANVINISSHDLAEGEISKEKEGTNAKLDMPMFHFKKPISFDKDTTEMSCNSAACQL